ncbi:hypothetical protein Ae201684P_015909 [Aphanomyces euteiches]|uniref:Integrase catalytic domain-containing protein n=1 Tax=Aphanomyces euteiches TaxID=100861 RepID=A0A6G0WBY5_9STRA|nr:hypothetical protein Ae201684_017140 [Aphanomyces euteiches]KAH9074010.1 hypothetical protein Ae201684P_015909 [Aphanomyces euteiches]KAH9137156.1 hypothetical protein AeRB84_017960 [Aphanomyces euteiches]
MALVNHIKSLGVTHETSAVDSQWQNGKAERFNQTLFEMAMAMMRHADMARHWWAEACATACYIRNRVVNTSSPTKTPLELLFGHKIVYKNWRVWGCIAYRLLLYQTRRNKLKAKSSKCIFLGYSETQKAYRVYDIADRKICVTTEVTFFDDVFHADEISDESDSDDGGSIVDDDGSVEDKEGEKKWTPPTQRFYGTNTPSMSNVQRFHGIGSIQQARRGGNSSDDDDVRAR